MSTFSKATQKLMLTIETLTSKAKNEPLTQNELVRLINARLNVENKTLSGVYSNVVTKPSNEIKDLLQIMCGNVVPTFETFKEEMLKKDASRIHFSNYSGLLALARLSKSAQIATKVARQGGTVTKAKSDAKSVENASSIATLKAKRAGKKVTVKVA